MSALGWRMNGVKLGSGVMSALRWRMGYDVVSALGWRINGVKVD